MSQETTIATGIKVKKRNGQMVVFNGVRISNAVTNSFKEHSRLPREQLIEHTAAYVHVMVSVDDGSLPTSILPLSRDFIREKNPAPS